VAWGRGGLLLQLLLWQKLHIRTTCCGSDARPGGMARGQLAVELSQILFVALWVMLFSVAVSMCRVAGICGGLRCVALSAVCDRRKARRPALNYCRDTLSSI
jgi:hypothetical protein